MCTQPVQQQPNEGEIGGPDPGGCIRPAGLTEAPAVRSSRERPHPACRTVRADDQCRSLGCREVRKGMRQGEQRDCQHGPEPARRGERVRAHRLADLILMVPALSELTAMVEPQWRLGLAGPCDGKGGRRERIRGRHHRGHLPVALLEQIEQHARTQSLRRFDPVRIQRVQVCDEVVVSPDRLRRCGRRVSIALRGEPAKVAVDEMCDDVAHAPLARRRRPLPVVGWKRAQQPRQLLRQRTEQRRRQDRIHALCRAAVSSPCPGCTP